jgi:hypothetical protein
VFYMFIATAPLNKGTEVAKAFLKAVETPPPPYLKSLGVYATYGDEGYKWYNLVEIDDDHTAEGLSELMKRTIPFDDVEGLKIKMENLISMRDSIELQMELSKVYARGEYVEKDFVRGE